MRELLSKFCNTNNLQFGITDNKKLKPKFCTDDTPFVNYSYEERTNPLIQMPSCKIFIVFLMPNNFNK